MRGETPGRGRPVHLNAHLLMRLDPSNPDDQALTTASPTSPSTARPPESTATTSKTSAVLPIDFNTMPLHYQNAITASKTDTAHQQTFTVTSDLMPLSHPTTTSTATTTTYLVLASPPPPSSPGYQPVLLRAHPPTSGTPFTTGSAKIFARMQSSPITTDDDGDSEDVDNNPCRLSPLVRTESLPAQISSTLPSGILQSSHQVLISDQAQRSLEAAGYPHTNDQPARICLQQRPRPNPTASAPAAPLQPSPPRVGVASSSCPSPSTAAAPERPSSSSSRLEHQNSWESIDEDDIKQESSSSPNEWSHNVVSSNPALVSDDDLNEDSSSQQGNASVITEYGGGSGGSGGGAIGQSDQPDTKDGMDELCPVCGDKVSGYHYGLLTCESCKGFFKRTVQNKKVYTCVADRSCIIDKTQRKRCPYCRFQKCLDVGMKLEAVRHDRMRGGRNKFGPMYKRDRARKLQVMRQRQAIVVHHNVLGGNGIGGGSGLSSGSQSLAAYASSSVYTPPTLHIKQEIQIPQVTSMTSSPGSSPGPLTQQTGLAAMGGSGLDHSQVLAQHTDPSTGGVQWQISSGSKEFQFQSGLGGGGLSSGGVVGGGKMPAILREFLTSLDDKEWQSELYKLLQSQSFNQVEVDLFELLCKVLDHNLFAQVDWARNSYYFKELKVDDQMTLLQNSWSEMLILDQIHQRMHNHLPDETTLHNGQKFELLSLALLGVPSMSDTFQELTNKLSALKFDSADFVCLKFVLLLNPDVRNLNNRKHVQDCYDQVRRVLLEYCVNCYPNVPEKYNQLLSLLPDLREMAQRGEDFLYFKHMQGNAPTQTLLMEMLHAKKR